MKSFAAILSVGLYVCPVQEASGPAFAPDEHKRNADKRSAEWSQPGNNRPPGAHAQSGCERFDNRRRYDLVLQGE